MEKPIAYDGDKPFVFISYSHRDIDRVWPIISQMNKNGYRVWYDDGIDPGTEWDEFIASKISDCDYFIGFMSANYIASDNCKDELNYARDQVDNRLLVYLEEVQLPKGMEMRLGRIQAIHKYNFNTENEFFAKLYLSKNLYSFRDEVVVKRINPEERKPFVAGMGSAAFGETVNATPTPAPAVAPIVAAAVPKASQNPPYQPQTIHSDAGSFDVSKVNAVSDKKDSKQFVLPSTKWGRWGIPGFRTGNAMHMVVSVIGLLVYFAILLLFIFMLIDNAYNDSLVSFSWAVIIASTVALLYASDYGWIQERWFKFHKLNNVVRGLLSTVITVCLAAIVFFLVVFIGSLFLFL